MASKTIRTIADLSRDHENARSHNPRNLGMLRTALQQVGAARSIVIDEAGRILAGNATIEAAELEGFTNVKVVEADGKTIIAVRRTGLSEDEKRSLALFDNRIAEMATWNAEVLAGFQEQGFDLDAFFSEHELDLLLAQVTSPDAEDAIREFTEEDAGRVKMQVCPNCGHKYSI